MIAAAITGLLGLGVWALWWDDVRGWLDLAPREQPVTPAVAAPRGT